MTVLSGFSVAANSWLLSSSDTNFDDWDNQLFEDRGSSEIDSPAAPTAETQSAFGMASESLSGFSLHSYREDWFNRIHYIWYDPDNPLDYTPAFFRLGVLAGAVTKTVLIWNAWGITRTLEDITPNDMTGITIPGLVAPSSWIAYQQKTYDVVITLDGPVTIDSSLTFDWDGTTSDDTDSIILEGSRVLTIPFPFKAPIKESLEWKTQLMVSNNGTEQRIRLRSAPRQSIDADAPVSYGDMALAENMLYGWRAKYWGVPMWMEAQKVTTVAAGATSVVVDTTASDYRVGSFIVLWCNTRQNSAFEIDAIFPGYVTLVTPTDQEYIAPWVMPLRYGRFTGTPGRDTNGYNASLDFKFEMQDNIDLAPVAPAQYLSNDIYYDPIFMSGQKLKDSYNTRLDIVDYGTAAQAAMYAPWLRSQITRPCSVTLQGLAAIWNFRKWLHRRAGRLRPFWQPTFENNLWVEQTGTILGSLRVKNDMYREMATDRSHIAIQKTDDTWLPRRVLATAVDADPDYTVLTLDSNLNIQPSQIRMVCFLGLKRLDADRVELQWTNNRVVRCSFRVVEVGS